MADTTNQKILIWARGRKGQQVGNGECWDLADKALRKSGAKSSADLGPMDKDANYVWGDKVELQHVLPGDVLQFRDFTVTTTTITEVTFADGSVYTQTKEHTANRGHHTAIVDATEGGGMFWVLEQHVKPLGKKVQRQKIHTLDSAPPGKTTHRTMKTATGKPKPAKVIETVTVKVKGTIWAYRPKPN